MATPSSFLRPEICDIGGRRELFVDDYLIDNLGGAEFRLVGERDPGRNRGGEDVVGGVLHGETGFE